MGKRKFIEFNANYGVAVRLTSSGMKFYEDDIKALGIEPKRPDQDGWYEFPLWELMKIFGQGMIPGSSLFVDSVVRFHLPGGVSDEHSKG